MARNACTKLNTRRQQSNSSIPVPQLPFPAEACFIFLLFTHCTRITVNAAIIRLGQLFKSSIYSSSPNSSLESGTRGRRCLVQILLTEIHVPAPP